MCISGITRGHWNVCIHEKEKKVKYTVYKWSINVYSWNTAAAALRPWPCLLPLGQQSAVKSSTLSKKRIKNGTKFQFLKLKEEKLLESGFWNCDWSKPQEGPRSSLFNFKLKPWSRWSDFHWFNEQCLGKNGPPNRQKENNDCKSIFKSLLRQHIWIYVEISPDVARDACLGGWGTDYQNRTKTSLRLQPLTLVWVTHWY